MTPCTHRHTVLRMTIARILGVALAAAVAEPAVIAAPVPCTPDSGVGAVTCSGDQGAGIVSGRDFASPPVYQVTIKGVTTTIAPPAGDAIYFRNANGGDIRVDIEPAPEPGLVTPRLYLPVARPVRREPRHAARSPR